MLRHGYRPTLGRVEVHKACDDVFEGAFADRRVAKPNAMPGILAPLLSSMFFQRLEVAMLGKPRVL